MSGTDLSNGICALLAIRLGFMYFGLSLPHTTNGRFNATISRAPVVSIGRHVTDASLGFAPAHVWISRPPANAQFSHDVSLKQTITFSVLMPA